MKQDCIISQVASLPVKRKDCNFSIEVCNYFLQFYYLLQDELKIDELGKLVHHDKGENDGKLILNLVLGYANGRYEVKEHYFLYDMNSFIADVGGYLGLLLGCSFLSLYTNGEEWITKKLK